MKIEFDPYKDAINRDKHGVSLPFGRMVWEDDGHVMVPTTRIEDGERRFKAVVVVDGRLWTAVHVYRGRVVRMISVRKSNVTEIRGYHRDTGRSG